MKTTSGQKLKIGVFTVIGIAILFIAIFLIGSQKNLFSSTYTVNGIFKNVGGLQVGNNVRLAGINVGVVSGINILTDTSVRVDISPGGAATTTVAEDGASLVTVPPIDVDKLVAKATTIIDNASTLTGDLSEIVAKINNGKGSIGRLLNNDKMAKDMENTVKEAKSTMSSVKTSTGTLNEDLKAAQGNFLLKGFFNKKKKAAQAKQDSINKAKGVPDTTKKKKRGFLGLGKG
jgi:phospholipid/cholesterol/gamma-HCH transport system substrate-binding protein